MNLNEMAKTIHEANVKKGFYDIVPEIGTSLMLVTSELAEALEADRKSRIANMNLFEAMINDDKHSFEGAFLSAIKDTFEDEIADAMIRLFDLSGYLGIDIEKHIDIKLKYNATRPNKHGKKY
jgi:NTP pyrophosphatase (non-canonical NTP hydrolase)